MSRTSEIVVSPCWMEAGNRLPCTPPGAPTRTAQASSRSSVGAKRLRKGIGDAGTARPNSPTSPQITSNTGILCDGLRVFDLDIDDSEIGAAVKAILVPFLPPGGLVRQRQGSPRIATILRAEGRPGKLSVAGARGKVEVLGVGQQVLVHGAHPSGGCWFFDGPAPWDVPLADVPTISEKIVAEALQAIAASGLLGPSVANPRAGGSGRGFRPTWYGSEAAALRARIVASSGNIRQGVAAFLADAVEGHRHNSLVSTAGLLIERGWPADRARTLMLDAASAWDGTNWPYDVDKAVAHALANQSKRKMR